MDQAQVDELLERLAATPGRIATATVGQHPEALAGAPSDDAWSAVTVLAHLRASDDILAPRLVAMLVRDEPALPAFDDRRWAEVMGYPDNDFQDLLAAFTFRRAELVRALRRVTSSAWERTGLHEVQGRITLVATLRHLVEHEAEHCTQIEALFAAH